MKKLKFLFVCLVVSLSYCAQNVESFSKIKPNVNFGIGGNLYAFHYSFHDTVDFNLIIDKKFQAKYIIGTLGASITFNKFKFESEILNLKLIRFNIGYNVLNFIKNSSNNHRIYINFSFGFLTHFQVYQSNFKLAQFIKRPDALFPSSYLTPLFGSMVSFQHNKFEIYYNYLNYRRNRGLNSSEHQHMLGIKYNIFKEKQ